MVIEFLVATTNRTDLSFLDRLFAQVEGTDYRVLVINQCLSIPLTPVHSADARIRCLSTQEKGIANSRNMALANAVGDWCVICDDDVVLEPGVLQSIRAAVAQSPGVSIFTFKIKTPEGKPYKSYPERSSALTGSFRLMRVSSIEIVVNRAAVTANTIRFTPWLGLGTGFSGGEEVVFLRDCLNRKLKIGYVNAFVVQHPAESSGKAFHKESNALANGALLKKLYPCSYLLWLAYFTLKRRKYYRGVYSVPAFFKVMLRGSRRMSRFMKTGQ